jgi:hypothetical protein
MTIIQKFEPEKEERKKFPKFTIIFIVVLVILGVLEIWVSHTLASYGEKFESMEKLKISLNLENKILENEIASFSTLYEIATKSATLGLTKAKDIQYIR